MTVEHEKDIKAGAILGVILLVLLWVFSIAFPGLFRSVETAAGVPGATNVGGVTLGGADGGTYNISPYSPSIGATNGGCCCDGGGGCPVSPDTIDTINGMLATATTAANQIFAAGNNTLDAIVAYNNQANPLLLATVG